MAADRFRTKSKAKYRETGSEERQVSLYSTICFETHSWSLPSVLDLCIYKFPELTCWYLKNVLRETQQRPICLKTWNTFVTEPPAKRTAIHRRKFPAGICEFGIAGWLCHVFTFLGHLGLKQLVVMTASVPTCLASSSGFSALQTWQNWKRSNNWLRNTICLGSVLKFVPANNNLQKEATYM